MNVFHRQSATSRGLARLTLTVTIGTARIGKRFCSLHSGTEHSRAAHLGGFDGAVSRLSSIMKHNETFVEQRAYEPMQLDPEDAKKARCVVLTCMDSRLTGLLPAAMGFKKGEAKFVKTAGAIVSHPFGSVMRSILVALYELRASEVYVVGHTDCGMGSLNPDMTVQRMLAAGVPPERFSVLESAGVNVRSFLRGFTSLDESVVSSADAVRRHPLMPPTVRVHGLIVDSSTGSLREAVRDPEAALMSQRAVQERETVGWRDGKPWG